MTLDRIASTAATYRLSSEELAKMRAERSELDRLSANLARRIAESDAAILAAEEDLGKRTSEFKSAVLSYQRTTAAPALGDPLSTPEIPDDEVAF